MSPPRPDAQFETLVPGVPAFGRMAVLPSDTQIFGFPVAFFEVFGDGPADEKSRADLAAHFQSWITRHSVSVCGCAIPAPSGPWKLMLPELGFRFVDLTIEVRLRDLRRAVLPEPRLQVRIAEPGDRAALEEMAARSFAHGRYFADPLFSPDLARRRYQHWIREALSNEQGDNRVFVIGESGALEGFFLARIQDGTADLRLAAVAPEFQGTGIGLSLYAAALHELRKAGVQKAFSNISAGNTVVLNLYSALGFRAANPKAIYHWHAARPVPGSRNDAGL